LSFSVASDSPPLRGLSLSCPASSPRAALPRPPLLADRQRAMCAGRRLRRIVLFLERRGPPQGGRFKTHSDGPLATVGDVQGSLRQSMMVR